MGFGSLALGAMLGQESLSLGAESSQLEGGLHALGQSGPIPKAKSVIWIFLVGGMSQMESFDPKPELNNHAGKTFHESPFGAVLESPYLKKNLREVIEGLHKPHSKIFPMQVGFQRYGQSGLEISDWWSNLGGMADDLCLVRGMWTTDNNHGAQLQFHTGRHVLEGNFPTIGAWAHYGLASINDSLPQFIVLGRPIADCCGGVGAHGANYLGPAHDGVQLAIDVKNPLPFAAPGTSVFREEQANEFELLADLHSLAANDFASDPTLAARAKSYELAFRMQQSIPEIVDFSKETEHTTRAYGLDQPTTRDFGSQCLAARRLVERGVRFIQLFHGSDGGAGSWDAHGALKRGHSALCAQVDQPIAALIRDLKMRGMLNETLVVIGTEFGRTPGAQGSDGRDHHPFGFSVALAGGGVKGGLAHGATDELGFHAVEQRHYVTDLHATVLHLLGLDPRRLALPERKRLDIDYGQVITEVIA